jgi:hypothetical protein
VFPALAYFARLPVTSPATAQGDLVHRPSRFLFPAALIAVSASLATVASAQSKDAQAKKLEVQAMDEDYLATNFAAAEAKLQQALKLCGPKGCSPQVAARLHVSLATVLGGGENKLEEAKAEFLEALKIDPTVKLDKDLTTPELQFTFDEAKNQLAGGGAGVAAPPTALAHTPVSEQALNTPVPVYVELPPAVVPSGVTLKYKAPGHADWKSIELKKVAQGWGGLVPCGDLTTEGDLEYYVLATDDSDAVLVSGGSRAKPYRVPMRDEISAEPPHLPGQPPPDACVKKAKPAPPPPPPKEEKILPPCESDRECEEGMICSPSGKCEEKPEGWQPPEAPAEVKRNWVGLVGAPDLVFVSGEDVCTSSGASNHFACFYSDKTPYERSPIPGRADNIQTGVAPSTIRVIAHYDRLFGRNVQLGLRVGFAFNGGPTPPGASGFLPVHVELRGTYFLGKDPFARTGVRPFVFAATGLAQVDTRVGVEVREPPSAACPANAGNECRLSLDSWHRSGLTFLGLGVGAQYAVTKAQALVLDVKVSEMLPWSALVVSPEVGFVTGF